MRKRREPIYVIPNHWTPLEKVCLVLIALFSLAFLATIAHAQEEDPRVTLGLVSPEVMEGSRLFFKETFNGNGRTCGTCHIAEDNLTFEADEAQALPLSDPLFALTVPGLERLDVLLSNGLILENVDGLDQPPVFRSTPHTLSLSTSITSRVDVPPGTDTVGWDGRGAPGAGTLRDFATGAVIQHATKSLERRPGIDFRLPTEEELDALLAFQLSLGRLQDIDLGAVRFSDPMAERGRITFQDPGALIINCARCHNNAGANRLDGSGNQNKDTGVDDLRVAGLPHDDGRGFPGDETFSPPPLIEAADTAPFFHTHTVDTIEAAVMFYTTEHFTGQRQTFTAVEGAEMAQMLRMLNASLNVQMTLQRLNAARDVEAAFPGHEVAGRLVDLASEEAEDAVAVTIGHSDVAPLAQCAHHTRIAASKDEQRPKRIEKAIHECEQANGSLGTGLEMVLGSGNLAQ